MRARLQIFVAALILGTTIARSEACSCQFDAGAEGAQIQREFNEARVVVVARLLSVRQTSMPDAPGYLIEDAEFVVSEVLKGDVAAGHKVRIRSHLGPGPCGRSAQNNPIWLQEPNSGPVGISGEWLIYGHGSEPYELSLCDRSMPISHRGLSDLQQLRKFLGRGIKDGI